MVLTAYSVLSPAIGRFCHRHWRKVNSANLMPASRHQDDTASPSAINAFVPCVTRVHRIPRPTCRDDRDTPLFIGHGMTPLYCCFYQMKKRKIFRLGTGQAGKSVAAASWFETVLRTSSP
jgi:hypothetical protein